MMTLLNFKPTSGKVLVEPIWQTPQVGRIVVPDAHQETNPKEATVVAISERAEGVEDLSVGNRVLTEAYVGTWIEIQGRRYRLLEPRDILALVEHNA